MPRISVLNLIRGVEYRHFGGVALSGRGGLLGRQCGANPAVIEEHVCDGCLHAERCAQGLACAALQLFVSTGRISAAAPRQPSRQIFEKLFG
jgi:hypothetical protein